MVEAQEDDERAEDEGQDKNTFLSGDFREERKNEEGQYGDTLKYVEEIMVVFSEEDKIPPRTEGQNYEGGEEVRCGE